MKVMLSLLSSFLLVMAAGGGLHKSSASAEGTIVSNSAAITASWEKMLPNTPMPSAIIELLSPPAGSDDHIGKQSTNNIQTAKTGTREKTVGTSFFKARKIGQHSSKEANTLAEVNEQRNQLRVWREYGPETEQRNQLRVWRQYGPETEQRNQLKVWREYGPETNGDGESALNVQAHGHNGESHKHVTISFLEDDLTPGSTIVPYIAPSSTSGAPLLPHDVADSIPMTTRNFTGIMTMFEPVSYTMANVIWSTLDLCDHPRPIKGEMKACIVSVESMVEFVTSVLGTAHGLRALSSADVPAEGITSGKMYKVVEVRRATEAGDTLTCHGMSFPFAVFMCHAVNPTRVYWVTLERECDVGSGGPEKMEALAICHLDTSDFDPLKMPGHVKPGDAPLCHFIARGTILWALAAAPASA